MENILNQIIARKEKEVATLKKELECDPAHPLHKILKAKHDSERMFEKALKEPGLSVIAEVKRRSPSAGKIGEIVDPSYLAKRYAEGGAAAISILTDSESFGGSLDDLRQVRQACALPVLRKDFTIDAVQIAEAISVGASAVLLIVAALKDKTKNLALEAERMGIDTLVEVSNEEELETALLLGARVIGVNNRDLTTFEVDTRRAIRLKKQMPHEIVSVAASGIKSVEDTKHLREVGYNAVLIGQFLVESENPEETIAKIRGVG